MSGQQSLFGDAPKRGHEQLTFLPMLTVGAAPQDGQTYYRFLEAMDLRPDVETLNHVRFRSSTWRHDVQPHDWVQVLRQAGVDVTERKGETDAYYLVSADRVVVPDRNSFDCMPVFLGVLFHELVHWTGNANRLKRLSRDDTDKDYAVEELVAELGALMLAVRVGLSPDVRNSAAYVKNWYLRLKEARGTLDVAAGRASRATQYLVDMLDKHLSKATA